MNNESFRLIYPFSKDEIGSFVICEVNKKTVGIITFGDPGCWADIEECLDTCIKSKCNVIIAASRTKGEIYDNLCAFGNKQGAEIIETSPIFIRNYDSSALYQDPFNEMTVKMLIDTLNHFLNL